MSRGGETDHCRLRGRSWEHLPYLPAVSEFFAGPTPWGSAEPGRQGKFLRVRVRRVDGAPLPSKVTCLPQESRQAAGGSLP